MGCVMLHGILFESSSSEMSMTYTWLGVSSYVEAFTEKLSTYMFISFADDENATLWTS